MKKENNKLKIMVFGAESSGYKVPSNPIEEAKYALYFHPLNTEGDFSDFDVVIFFDKAFEKVEGDAIVCANKAEMLKRVKQAFSLIEKGGIVCSLVYSIRDAYSIANYISSNTYESKDTSLIKVILNDIGLDSYYRKRSSDPLKHFKIHRNEYIKYLGKYGVTETTFDMPSHKFKNIKPICSASYYLAGAIIWDKIILLPCLAPDKNEKSTSELFISIATALSETIQKISIEIPDWLKEQIILPDEKKLLVSLKEQQKIIEELKLNIKAYEQLKGCLCFNSDALVESVSFTLTRFLNIRVEKPEGFVEDLKLFEPGSGESSVHFAIAEVKGVNAGVKREHINQVDSHRERLGLSHDFPALLIINTKMDARDLAAKELDVASEQIKKAVSDNILIITTLDLINIIFLMEEKKIVRDELLNIFKGKAGWLKATKDELVILD
ncbi:MAG: hypothetical protein Q8M71_11750 [Thermodesulfovibrionales bacterium]|nr:hypothetical protein [Thermodesulfovibrionales bacterium]